MRNSTHAWTKRIPKLACSMESLLYRNASSFAEYMDMSTLPYRLDTAMSVFVYKVNSCRVEDKFNVDQLSDSLKEKLQTAILIAKQVNLSPFVCDTALHIMHLSVFCYTFGIDWCEYSIYQDGSNFMILLSKRILSRRRIIKYSMSFSNWYFLYSSITHNIQRNFRIL